MAASKEQLQAWLSELPDQSTIWIDEGGLTLIAEGNGIADSENPQEKSYYEIGGQPIGCSIDGCDSEDEMQSTYCGSFCETHLADHCAECEVCANDFLY